jgi:hypothetical protein
MTDIGNSSVSDINMLIPPFYNESKQFGGEDDKKNNNMASVIGNWAKTITQNQKKITSIGDNLFDVLNKLKKMEGAIQNYGKDFSKIERKLRFLDQFERDTKEYNEFFKSIKSRLTRIEDDLKNTGDINGSMKNLQRLYESLADEEDRDEKFLEFQSKLEQLTQTLDTQVKQPIVSTTITASEGLLDQMKEALSSLEDKTEMIQNELIRLKDETVTKEVLNVWKDKQEKFTETERGVDTIASEELGDWRNELNILTQKHDADIQNVRDEMVKNTNTEPMPEERIRELVNKIIQQVL